MAALDDLLEYIFEKNHAPLCAEFAGWVRGSRRYKAFAISYRSKIRTKLKSARDEGGLLDVRAELETAKLLLHEERFTLEYEKYAAAKQRGPDFTVTFRTHTPFNVEVRRIRNIELDPDSVDMVTDKLLAVVCEKVRQMPPSIVNLLWLSAEREISAADLNTTNLALRQLAERKAEDFFTRRGFKSAADFLRQYQQLSGIVVCQGDVQTVWLNTLARHPLPPDILRAIERLKAG